MNSEYFKHHRLDSFFEELFSKLEYEQPNTPLEYIVNHIKDQAHSPEVTNEPITQPITRRGAVSARTITEDEIKDFELRVIPNDEQTNKAISEAIATCLLFKHLEDDEKQKLCNAFEPKNYPAGTDIIVQGTEGNEFYYLRSGTVDVIVDDVRVSSITQGGTFGELALIYGTPRAATIRAVESSKCLALDSDSYNVIVKGSMMKKRKIYEEFLAKVPILGPLDGWERLTVADALEVCNFGKDDIIIEQGTDGDSFYIILEGEVYVTQRVENKDHPGNFDLKEVGHLGVSDYFGEVALLTRRPRAATVTASTPVKCVRLDRGRFERVMGPCIEILNRNVDKYHSFISLGN